MQKEIRLEELFSIFKKRISLIGLFSLLGLLVSGIYSFFVTIPIYESTSKIVVNQTQNANQVITNNDIQTNLNLISTYQSIIKEPIILQEVIEDTGSALTVEKLRDKISIQSSADSLVFGVTVADEDPYIAADLANSISEVFEEKIGEILDVQTVTILSTAIPSLRPVSPKTTMNVTLGFIVGLMSGVGTAFLLELMDKTVKGSQFINENIGWTDLGSISMMTEKEKKEVAKASRPELAFNSRRRV